MAQTKVLMLIKNMAISEELFRYLKDHEVSYTIGTFPGDYFYRGRLEVSETDGQKLIDFFGKEYVDFAKNMDG